MEVDATSQAVIIIHPEEKIGCQNSELNRKLHVCNIVSPGTHDSARLQQTRLKFLASLHHSLSVDLSQYMISFA
ncbi:hypothetical protein LIER_01841 [Lithospermum erythrorhizon]|uniref:Uncharacterized protein n=1 Tax=Lithospermum erythrorhizon TaxID=34254 RepID=A0AAV3NR38_LITER